MRANLAVLSRQHRNLCSGSVTATEPEWNTNLVVQVGECTECGATLERTFWDDDEDRLPAWGHWHVVDA